MSRRIASKARASVANRTIAYESLVDKLCSIFPLSHLTASAVWKGVAHADGRPTASIVQETAKFSTCGAAGIMCHTQLLHTHTVHIHKYAHTHTHTPTSTHISMCVSFWYVNLSSSFLRGRATVLARAAVNEAHLRRPDLAQPELVQLLALVERPRDVAQPQVRHRTGRTRSARRGERAEQQRGLEHIRKCIQQQMKACQLHTHVMHMTTFAG